MDGPSAETLLGILRDELHAQAEAARHDVSAFMEFVMEEETTRAPITVAPHQHVLLDFALAHDRSVIMLPVGHSKTFCMAALTLFLMGQNPTLRGAVVSSTQGQASKVVAMVRDYIESSDKLHMVFPHLVKSHRLGDPWTQTEITVERPPGIRDASLIAVGVDGAIAGARLNWIIVDDILDRENTATKEQRDKVYEWFDSSVLSRLDPRGARIVCTNTAWHPEDLVHRLEKQGWPTLRMDIMGNVFIKDDIELIETGKEPWDSDHLRPASPSPHEKACRLVAYDPDPTNSQTLWPARISREEVEKLRRRHLPSRFNQLFMNICRDDDSAKCKSEWIEACKQKSVALGHTMMVSKYEGPNLTFTGLDLAVNKGEENDDTAFFTFEILPNGLRKILDIDIGQFDGPTILDKLFAKQKAYNSIVRVENNGAQDYLRQFALQRDVSLPVKPHTTGRAKAHPEFGVEGLFIEIYNAAWLIPCDRHGQVHPMVQKWIDSCLYYAPAAHTPDVLMACYFAREQAREWGVLSGSDTADLNGAGGDFAMGIMAR